FLQAFSQLRHRYFVFAADIDAAQKYHVGIHCLTLTAPGAACRDAANRAQSRPLNQRSLLHPSPPLPLLWGAQLASCPFGRRISPLPPPVQLAAAQALVIAVQPAVRPAHRLRIDDDLLDLLPRDLRLGAQYARVVA